MATNLTCTNSDDRFILEFIGCDLVVVQNAETVFKAKGLSLCPWFDEVCDYCYCKHTIAKNGTISVSGPLNANFLYMKIDWPSTLAESKRRAAIQLPDFSISQTGGVFTDNGLGEYASHTYPLQDLFMINSVDQYEEYKLHNYTDETMVVHVITATHCDSSAGSSGATGSYPTGGTSVPDYIG